MYSAYKPVAKAAPALPTRRVVLTPLMRQRRTRKGTRVLVRRWVAA